MISAKTTLETKPRFTRADLRDLAGAGDGWRLSLYMPLERTGRDVHKAPILLKDLRARAARQLSDRAVPPAEAEGMLAAVDRILREADTTVLQGAGLAVFAAGRQAFSYLLPVRPEAAVSVNHRFRLDPILPMLYEDEEFYLLALGLKGVRLFEGGRGGLAEIPLAGVPDNLREAVNSDVTEDYLTFHTAVAPSGGGKGQSVFHGHGGGAGDRKELKKDILRFFQQLDRGIRPLLRDPDRPLLIAGVEAWLPIYREANTYSRILDVSLPAHLEKLSGIAELHAQALALCEREIRADRKARLALYRERLASPGTAAGITEVVPAAEHGRVSHLFVRRGYRAGGVYDPASAQVRLPDSPQSGDEDLVGLAASFTVMGAGKVHVMEDGEIPEGAEIAALCRY